MMSFITCRLFFFDKKEQFDFSEHVVCAICLHFLKNIYTLRNIQRKVLKKHNLQAIKV